jgi:hypothetical protein
MQYLIDRKWHQYNFKKKRVSIRMFVWPCITRKQTSATNKQIPFIDFLNQPYMFRATNSPILMSTFDRMHSFWYNAPTLLRPVRSAAVSVHCTKSCIYSQKCPWGWANLLPQSHRSAAESVHCTKSCVYSQNCSWLWVNLSPETCRADLKRSINGICCILLVAYIVNPWEFFPWPLYSPY